MKASLVNDEKESDFDLVLESFDSFFKLLEVNEIPINFNELKVVDLFWTIQFFAPECKALGEDLEDDLIRVLAYLYEKKWLNILKTIETIENNLEAAKTNLGSTYLNKEYIKEDNFLKKMEDPLRKELVSGILKLTVPPILLYIFSVLTGIIK